MAASPARRSATRQATATTLNAGLALDKAGLDAFGALFVQCLATTRLDGELIFNRLCAGQSFAEALDLPPCAADILYARAHQWYATGRLDRAERLFKALCVIAGDIGDHWVGYGICLKRTQQFLEAERVLTAAARLRPDWMLPPFHLFEVYASLGDWTRAGESLASFDALKDLSTPTSLVAESERYREALSRHSASARVSCEP